MDFEVRQRHADIAVCVAFGGDQLGERPGDVPRVKSIRRGRVVLGRAPSEPPPSRQEAMDRSRTFTPGMRWAGATCRSGVTGEVVRALSTSGCAWRDRLQISACLGKGCF